jgi:3-deoxy-manno-octulosonate cytidylyltransferase (CMP-KDO synthetase)
MKIIGIIPARYGSTRLEAKVLRAIAGRPMIEHVFRRAKTALKLDDVLVACDDVRIKTCAEAAGATVWMTRTDHPNGTSRIAEVAAKVDADVFINIQGDEPLIHPENIDLLADVFLKHPEVRVATLAVPKDDPADYVNPGVVKVVCDEHGDALCFSRAPIPFYRDSAKRPGYLKHLGIYGYRRDFLTSFVTWPSGRLEEAEKLEQLRILERGCKLRVVETVRESVSVDTAEDLMAVEKKMKRDGIGE